MTEDSKPRSFLSFSTSDFPLRERLSAWRETYARNIIRVEPHPYSNQPFQSHLKVLAMPDVNVCYGETTAATYKRTPALTTSDEFLFLIFKGNGSAIQRNVDTSFEAGDATLLSGADIGETQHPASSYLAVVLPHDVVVPMVRDPGGLLARKIPGSNQSIRLLSGYLNAIENSGEDLSKDVVRLISTHIVDLVGSALGTTGDYGEMAHKRGMRVARLLMIKEAIAANYTSPSLTIGSVAKRAGISPRYIRRLFEEEETTFTQYIRNLRLDRAHRLLTADSFSMQPITAIAFEAGFSDISHFNRAFKIRFHETPSDVRAEAVRRKGILI
jgi:AraC-like DNA-binding protein